MNYRKKVNFWHWEWMLLVIICVLYVGGFTYTMTLTGCAARKPGVPKPLPVGARNGFDATTYDFLRTAQGAIDGFKQDFNSLPLTEQQKIAPVMNQAITDYNTAEAAWQVYHATATNDVNALTSAIWQLTADLARLAQSLPNSKPKASIQSSITAQPVSYECERSDYRLEFSTDTGMSRDAAGVFDFGNGTQGYLRKHCVSASNCFFDVSVDNHSWSAVDLMRRGDMYWEEQGQ